MKKRENNLAKITALVVFLVVLALILISATYAKYVTSNTGTDKSRVAHWDINSTNTIKDLFASSYTNVKSGTEEEGIIAPGTSGSFKFSITGSVETAYKLKINATGTDDINGAVNGYNPIKYTFQKNSEAVENVASFDALLEKINAIAGDAETEHQPGKLGNDIYTIGWEWTFENAEDKDTTDAKDTQLGKLVASGDKTISLSVEIEATQVD